MTGASLTVVQSIPQGNSSLIYFTVTLDGSAKADFSDYSSVQWVNAIDTTSFAPEDAAAYTAGGDITFTNASNPIQGMAAVTI